MITPTTNNHPPIGGRPSIAGIHHLELYVSDGRRTADLFHRALGLRTTAILPPVSSAPDRFSRLVERGDIHLIVTEPLTGSSDVADYLRRHGDSVKDIAFAVPDVDGVFDRAVAAGARPLRRPSGMAQTPLAETACISACGDLVHSLVPESPRRPPVSSDGRGSKEVGTPTDSALEAIDHVAFALPKGDLERWVRFYTTALGFRESYQADVSTEYSAMRSKVVETGNGAVRFPLMEPAAGRRQSQIEEFVNAHGGPGAQHIAFRSHDILRSVAAMEGAVEFLTTPAAYYDSLTDRVGELPDFDAIRRRGILVDRDATGTLLQVFTKPVGSRPTLFLEVIERRGAESFGGGNVRALYEAVERIQNARGSFKSH